MFYLLAAILGFLVAFLRPRMKHWKGAITGALLVLGIDLGLLVFETIPSYGDDWETIAGSLPFMVAFTIPAILLNFVAAFAGACLGRWAKQSAVDRDEQ